MLLQVFALSAPTANRSTARTRYKSVGLSPRGPRRQTGDRIDHTLTHRRRVANGESNNSYHGIGACHKCDRSCAFACDNMLPSRFIFPSAENNNRAWKRRTAVTIKFQPTSQKCNLAAHCIIVPPIRIRSRRNKTNNRCAAQ